jgi:catechol 2,3-dioxygenase-like lactoylglutathione lyase family enzyme
MSPEPVAGLDSQTRDHAKEWSMPDDATATGIREVGTVFVPVSDQDRSLEFFVGQLGFEKRADFAYGGQHRWIEVAPPGVANAIALVPPSEGASAGADVARCAFATADIESAHAALRARGVDVDAEIARAGTRRSGLVSPAVFVEDPVPPQFFVRDPDGNRFLIVEAG